MRQSFRFDKQLQKMVPITEQERVQVHAVQQDTIGDTWAPFDGKVYDSKSRLRAAAAAQGLVELGDAQPKPKAPEAPKGIRDTLERQYHILKDMTPETRQNYMRSLDE